MKLFRCRLHRIKTLIIYRMKLHARDLSLETSTWLGSNQSSSSQHPWKRKYGVVVHASRISQQKDAETRVALFTKMILPHARRSLLCTRLEHWLQKLYILYMCYVSYTCIKTEYASALYEYIIAHLKKPLMFLLRCCCCCCMLFLEGGLMHFKIKKL